MTENLELDITLDAHPSTDNSIDSFADAVKNYIDEVLLDYELCVLSRDISLIGRREVLTGKGKFGIFGDGKETAQVAMARTFGDCLARIACLATLGLGALRWRQAEIRHQ